MMPTTSNIEDITGSAERFFHSSAYFSQPLVLNDIYAENGSTLMLIPSYGWLLDGAEPDVEPVRAQRERGLDDVHLTMRGGEC